MAITPLGARLRTLRSTFVFAAAWLVLALLALSGAQPAAAAETTAGNYAVSALEYAPGSLVQHCRSWSGDADDAGHFYMNCPGGTYPYVYEFDADGRYLGYAQLPASYKFDDRYRMRDVAAAPDGRTLYVSVGPIVDNLGAHPERAGGAYAGAILRLRRQADGSWAHDAGFRAGPFPFTTANGTAWWAARYLDVDAAGRIYAAVNAYVYELSADTGDIVSRFGGGRTETATGRWLSGMEVPQGLAVSADGSSIFVVEQKHHIVQRWERTGATTWARQPFGPNANGVLGVPDVEGAQYCGSTAHFQSPYDVAVDAAGDVYVADVSCRRIQRFTKDGAFVQTVWSNGPDGELNHGFAMNRNGSFLLPELERKVIRLDPPAGTPQPAPATGCADTAAPKITGATVAVAATRAAEVTVTATDDCGIAQIRVSGDILGAPTWADGAAQSVQLRGWNGRKRLVVEVADGAKHVARTVVVTRLALRQPPLRARGTVRLRGAGCAPGNPLARVGGASSYRLADRCARYAGRIVRLQRTRNGVQAELLLPLATSRALYANAVGPVRMWVVADSASRLLGRPRVGGRAVVTSAVIATRSGSAVFGVPVTRFVAS